MPVLSTSLGRQIHRQPIPAGQQAVVMRRIGVGEAVTVEAGCRVKIIWELLSGDEATARAAGIEEAPAFLARLYDMVANTSRQRIRIRAKRIIRDVRSRRGMTVYESELMLALMPQVFTNHHQTIKTTSKLHAMPNQIMVRRRCLIQRCTPR